MSFLGFLIFHGCLYSFLHSQEVPGNENQTSNGETDTQRSGIKGPKSLSDKILIVGGGPSGIHMAYLLKSKGFTDVTVFEKESRIGGQSYTIYHRGTPHDMGNAATTLSCEEVIKLIRYYDAGKLLPFPSFTLWTGSPGNYMKTDCRQLVIALIRQTKPDGALSNQDAAKVLEQAVKNYITIYTHLFSSYKGSTLMPRPSLSVLRQINMTYLDFLKMHDAEALSTIFLCLGRTFGYGLHDQIPALYMLILFPPKLITELLSGALTGHKDSTFKILSKGSQFLWEEIARQENLKVKLNRRVVDINRLLEKIDVTFQDGRCGLNRSESFDFLILSPDMSLVKRYMTFKPDEKIVFSGTEHTYYTVSLVDHHLSPTRSETPIDKFVFNALSQNESMVYLTRDSFAALNYIVGDNYTSSLFPDGKDGKPLATSVVTQVSRGNPELDDTAEKNLGNHFRDVMNVGNNFNVVSNVTFAYFPRYSADAIMRGVLWDIVDMQGRYNTWYIGSSVSIEAVQSVVDYNLMLMRKFTLPTV